MLLLIRVYFLCLFEKCGLKYFKRVSAVKFTGLWRAFPRLLSTCPLIVLLIENSVKLFCVVFFNFFRKFFYFPVFVPLCEFFHAFFSFLCPFNGKKTVPPARSVFPLSADGRRLACGRAFLIYIYLLQKKSALCAAFGIRPTEVLSSRRSRSSGTGLGAI